MERDQCLQRFFLCLLNFNSHAHVERDIGLIVLLCVKGISTHTLTWSVTNCSNCCCKILIISTHTLTWSVTCDEICIQHQNLYFNSHAHVERDVIIVSLPLKYLNFNSHAHVERDSSPIVNAYGVVYFNSHAHVERDALLKFSLCQIIGISTHTLTWSVT